jgi:hypothetical protein
MTDRLTLARALEEGGASRDAAEHIATEIYDAIHDNVATKSDVDLATTTLRTEITAVRADLRQMEQRLEHQITRMTIRLGVFVVAVAGLASTIVHFWR